MFSLMLKRDFIAQHYLIGKNWGAENNTHYHQYSMELEIESKQLDQYNYLLDIVDVQKLLEQLIVYFNDKILNDLPEFNNQNPSLELFAKILWEKFAANFQLAKPATIIIRLWEDTIARASYRDEKK